MTVYNKLIRDFIPLRLSLRKIHYRTRVLSHEEFVLALRDKLIEEVSEFLVSPDSKSALEELADILEVVYELGRQSGAEPLTLEGIRADKARASGKFEARLFLIDTEDEV